jgi:Asp-tRNA(Asn)/Glu-tRNA(Gln) amidotransferase A subunit family amidase
MRSFPCSRMGDSRGQLMAERSDRHASTTPVEATAADDATGLAFRTATELAEALAQRKISPRELLDSAISHRSARPKDQRGCGARLDRAHHRRCPLARGEHRPLLGLPMTVKQQLTIAGLPTTWGDPDFRDWRAAPIAFRCSG